MDAVKSKREGLLEVVLPRLWAGGSFAIVIPVLYAWLGERAISNNTFLYLLALGVVLSAVPYVLNASGRVSTVVDIAIISALAYSTERPPAVLIAGLGLVLFQQYRMPVPYYRLATVLGTLSMLGGQFAADVGRLGTGFTTPTDNLATLSVIVALVAVGETLHSLETKRRSAEDDLRCTQRRQTLLHSHAGGAYALFGAGMEIVEVGPSYARILGWRPDEIAPDELLESIHPDDREYIKDAWALRRSLPGSESNFEVRVRHGDGSWRWLRGTFANHFHDPHVQAMVVNLVDVTGEKDAQLALVAANSRHPVTGLPNRHEIALELARISAKAPSTPPLDDGPDSTLKAARARHQHFVLSIRIDQLAIVARAYGKATADEAIVALAKRLAGAVRESDLLGQVDEETFAVICVTTGNFDAALQLAERIKTSLLHPIEIAADTVIFTASTGVSSGSLASEEDALANAELAMASAIAQGGNRWSIFQTSDRDAALHQVVLPAQIRKALKEGQFVLYYQPVVALDKVANSGGDEMGRIVGAEALIRWQHPELGLLSPDRFIPAAELSGLIVPLGTWVLWEACRTAARWSQEPDRQSFTVSVNLSSLQLADPLLPELVSTVLRSTGLRPAQLTLEVTESVLVEDPKASAQRLCALRQLGVHVAIDDFGTGYSSLAYLKDLPLDILKIDRSFVSGLGLLPGDRAIASAVMALATALGLGVVAEGVETSQQAAQLREMHCGLAQGYLYSRPLAETHFGKLMERSEDIPRSPAGSEVKPAMH